MADKRDYYEVLGVDKSASEKDLKNAFRSLARKYHPDRSSEPDAEDKFKEIQDAYAVLSDSQKRAQYDRFGHQGPGGNPFGGFGGGGGFNINLEDLFGGDIFSQMFGGGRGGSRQRSGNDILIKHSIEFIDVLEGSKEEITIDLPAACSDCDGTGAQGGEVETCGECGGQGRVRVRQQIGPFVQDVVRDCAQCSGRGSVSKNRCKPCSGKGVISKSKTLRFNVPLGAESGTRLRMRGEGEPAPHGKGVNGDLFIELEVEEHQWFDRSGADLVMILPVGYADLILGKKMELEHFDGEPLKIEIPAKSKPDETIVIKKRGLSKQRGSGRGDVIIALDIYVPKKVSKATKKILKDLQEELTPDNLEDAAEERAAEIRGRRARRRF